MEIALVYSLKEFCNRLTHEPSQGQIVALGYPLQFFELVDGQGNGRTHGLHASSKCITLMHISAGGP